ncbi:N-acetylglucosamine kinase [Kaistia sp. 32K]|uniref:BadF/BadG/BcrA/BcrD ATPase family protein n=1 Tax=Kaistia sp. 32K TaxID=2795690 RepID=UPI001915DA76|nr:BadF/BadG/BcrA/BcrD ATPase family protein [Kaistia sp. 32K]BCP54494.1 N-acetylglucosamine kinase [Kaistia sp. 32K]
MKDDIPSDSTPRDPGELRPRGRAFLLVGVDGGGTRCRARARFADGTLIGECITGTANILAGIDDARDNIIAAVEGALVAGGLTSADLDRCLVGLGLAGANIPDLSERFLASGLPFAQIALEMDAWIACRGAHPEGDGAIAILGTGTAYVVQAGGDFVTVGGWGFHLGDQGSGAWLGHQALRRSVLAHDGIVPATPLSKTVMARFDDKPDRMVSFCKTALPRDYGSFAPLVFEHAAARDSLAEAILAEATLDIEASLARLVELGAKRISLLGGLAPLYQTRLSPGIAAFIVPPAGDPLDGALALAATLLPVEAAP